MTPLLVPSNGVTVETFFLEFLEPGSYPIKFFLLEQKGVVTETRSCADRRNVVDAVSKKISVQVGYLVSQDVSSFWFNVH